MADYISKWEGPVIDQGIEMAINGIGCKRYPDATLDRPLDLNKLHDTIITATGERIEANGSWLVEYYINGPIVDLSSANTSNYTPIQINVYVANNYTYQSTLTDGIYFYRFAPIGQDVTMEWMMAAYPRMENDISEDPSMIVIQDHRVALIDRLYLIVKLNTDCADNVVLKLNDLNGIPVYTSDGMPYTSGAKKGSIVPFVYNKEENRFYLIGGGGTKWITDTFALKADKAVPPITENVNTPMTKVTVNEQGIVTKVEQATSSDIKHGDGTLNDALQGLTGNIGQMFDLTVQFDIDGTVDSSWQDIPVE